MPRPAGPQEQHLRDPVHPRRRRPRREGRRRLPRGPARRGARPRRTPRQAAGPGRPAPRSRDCATSWTRRCSSRCATARRSSTSRAANPRGSCGRSSSSATGRRCTARRWARRSSPSSRPPRPRGSCAGPGLRAFTPRTLTDPAALARDLARTAARGYSIDDGEHEEGVRCVGAPIRNRDGIVFASLSVSGPAHRVSPARDAEIARRVVAAAGEISRRLGWLPQGSGAGHRAVPRGKPIRHAKGGAAAADRIRETGSRRLPSKQKRR